MSKEPGAQGKGRVSEGYAGRIRVRKGGPADVSVEFSGELDVATADGLRGTLGWASGSGRSVAVDLSGVSFLDSSCLRELVVHQRSRPARVAFATPHRRLTSAWRRAAWRHGYTSPKRHPAVARPPGCRRESREGRERVGEREGDEAVRAPHARDGAVGRVHEICFEEEGWGVEHLVAFAGDLLFNRLVLVDVEHSLGGTEPTG